MMGQAAAAVAPEQEQNPVGIPARPTPQLPPLPSQVSRSWNFWSGRPQRAASPQDHAHLMSALVAAGTLTGVEMEDVVCGMPLVNEPVFRAVRQVIVLSVLIATYYVVGFVWQLLIGMYGTGAGASDALWSGLSQLAIELSIPACGYYGAIYAHRTMIFFFCGANIIFIVAAAIGFFRLLVIMCGNSKDMCKEELTTATTTCDIMVANGPKRILLLSSMALLTLLGCLSFAAGKKLYHGLRTFDSTEARHAAVHVRGEPIVQAVQNADDSSLAAASPGQGDESPSRNPVVIDVPAIEGVAGTVASINVMPARPHASGLQ